MIPTNHEPRTTIPDARARATAFILSLPKFEGMQQASPEEPEKYKLYRELIDKLEREFENVAIEAQRYTERTGMMFNKMPFVRKPNPVPESINAFGHELPVAEDKMLAPREVTMGRPPVIADERGTISAFPYDVMPDECKDQIIATARERMKIHGIDIKDIHVKFIPAAPKSFFQRIKNYFRT